MHHLLKIDFLIKKKNKTMKYTKHLQNYYEEGWYTVLIGTKVGVTESLRGSKPWNYNYEK